MKTRYKLDKYCKVPDYFVTEFVSSFFDRFTLLVSHQFLKLISNSALAACYKKLKACTYQRLIQSQVKHPRWCVLQK